MPDISPTLPTVGQPNSTEEPKIVSALSALVGAVNDIDTANISATAGILDTQLASPNNALWKPLASVAAIADSATTVQSIMLSNGTVLSRAGGVGLSFPVKYLDPAEYVIAGKTPKLRLRAAAIVNNVAPGVTYTFDLCRVTTVAAPSGGVILTLAAATATVAFVAPGALGGSQATGTEVGMGVAGHYVLTVTPSASPAAGSTFFADVTVQYRHI